MSVSQGAQRSHRTHRKPRLEVLEQQLRTQDPLDEEEQTFTVVFDTERDDERAIAQKAQQLARLHG